MYIQSNTTDMNIGKAIKIIRTEKDLSQKQIAAKINISQTSMSRIEKGLKNPRHSTILNIANSLNISVAYLMFRALDKEDFINKDEIRSLLKELIDKL